MKNVTLLFYFLLFIANTSILVSSGSGFNYDSDSSSQSRKSSNQVYKSDDISNSNSNSRKRSRSESKSDSDSNSNSSSESDSSSDFESDFNSDSEDKDTQIKKAQKSLNVSSNSACPSQAVRYIREDIMKKLENENSTVLQISMTADDTDEDTLTVDTRATVLSGKAIEIHEQRYSCKKEDIESLQ